jgi:hypothetical protein
VLFLGVVSAQTKKVVEFFLEREAAEPVLRRICGSRRSSSVRQHPS